MRKKHTSQRLGALLFLLVCLFTSLKAQNCTTAISLSEGYTTSITNVVPNSDGSNTITLQISNNGCSSCKKLQHLYIQAAPGTYSNVSVQVLSGPVTYSSIDMGPTLHGVSIQGFEIHNISAIGNGQAGSFTVTYRLTGPLQNQEVRLKTQSPTYNASFSAAHFQTVRDCMILNANTCANKVTLTNGYTASITNVIPNTNGSNTISLTVLNNGSSSCNKLDHLYIQATPGTYSNISVQSLTGSVTYSSINMGPTLPGVSIQGFKIYSINGIGNGLAASFRVTYTLTGSLQNQQVILKTTSPTLTASFTAANFQAVSDCLNPPTSIVPYFTPYANKVYDIIGVELTSLYYTYQSTGSYISNDIFQILGSSVRVSVRTKAGQHTNAVNLLTTAPYGLVQEYNDPVNNVIEGTFPILNLLSLNQLPNLLVSVRPIYAALHNVGLITSQGDTALRSFRARDVFGVDGQGVKVGVISDSYNTILGNPAADDVVRKDLPGATNPDHPTPVQVLQDYPFGTRTDEGRAMLQIVHDVAPGAELAFRTGFLGAVDMANGIRALEQSGCDVIVDDVSYIAEPFFRDGVIAQAVDQVKALGVSYFSAAGNFGTNSWQGTFAPVAPPTGVVGQAHNFQNGYGTGTDILQSINLHEGEYTIVLQWDDGTPGLTTNSDFDIYLANNSGGTLFGFNRMNVGGEPVEVLPFVVTAPTAQSNIVIVRESGTAAATLKYVVYRGLLEINEYGGLTASTITGQANAAGAMAVGAVLYTNTPEYSGVLPSVASFSSRGGTLVNGVNRSKPEFCAPNGVNTSVDLGGVNYDGDLFPNFFGTSAAAPHAAGVAALLLQARTKYYGNALSPDGLKTLLQSTAIDMSTPGYDVASGAGFITADRALMELANPSPYIHTLSYDTTLTPGVDTLELTIYGEYLNPSSTIYLDGVPVTTGVVIQGDTAIITTVLPFTSLYPAIQAFNPPKAGTNGLDGGLSDPLYFTTKETILVTVDNKSKKYGEILPAFTATYTLESVDGGEPLASAGLTPGELDRVLDIDLTTVATTQSNVGLWGISGDPNDPLSPNSNLPVTSPSDIALLQKYNIVFRDGVLTIDPADLTITPRDTTFIYNDSIVGLHFNYVFTDGSSGILNMAPGDDLAILNAVKSAHGTALVNATAVVRGTALVNNEGDPLLTEELLNDFSFMISQAVKQVRGTALVNGELIDAAELYTATALTNAEARLVRGTALVNAYTLVRGTALVNDIDSTGNITNTSSLTNSGSLVNSAGLLNSSTISLNSNTHTLAILGDFDVAILAGDSVGEVIMRSVNLVTGNTVGTHLIVPGTFLSNNFNVHYGIGHLTILPATAQYTIDANTLTQTYDGTPKTVGVSAEPEDVPYTITYNGSTTPPVNAGTYAVLVTVNDPNYTGTTSATLEIQKAAPQITVSSTTQTYNGSPKSVSVSVVPSGEAYTVTYNGSSTLPVNAGSYAVVVTVNTANYQGTATATLEIQKATAQITITSNSCNQTYNGSPKSVSVSVVPSGQAYTVTYNGSSSLPVNAGSYAVVVTVNSTNYQGTATATLVIQKANAQITITSNSCNQTYNGSPKSVSVSTNPTGLAYTVTYNGSSSQPVNAGTYTVVATVNSTNYQGTATATLVIQKATAQISITQTTQVYSATPKSVTVTTVPAGLTNTVTYSGSTTQKVNAGSYPVVVTVSNTNYQGTAYATLVIQKAPATATTGIYSMNKGASLPSFTATYSGFLGGQTSSVVTSVSFSLSPSCSGNVAGVYSITVNATAANYVFTSVNGTLYVNPAGSGTKQVKPIFVCRETLTTPVAGFYYRARFTYENQNSTPVYIPVGANNTVTGSGFSATGQPVVFQPGGGTWYVPYDGGTLQWKITSNKSPSGTGLLQASATNAACGSGMITEEDGGDLAEDIARDGDEENADQEVTTAVEEESGTRPEIFPNPSTGRVFLRFAQGQAAETGFAVYNALGVQCVVQVMNATDRTIELDLAPFGSGMYIIQVITGDRREAFPVVIE